MKLAFYILMILAVAGICGPGNTLSVCEALKQRTSLSRKIVAVRGIQVATDEGAWLKGTDCGETITVAGRTWPTFIWLDMSTRSRNAAGFASSDLNEAIKKINAEIAKQGFDAKRDRLWLTYVGLLEADDESGEHVDKDFGRGQAGFGHLNAAAAQLIVRDVRDPAIERGPKSPGK